MSLIFRHCYHHYRALGLPRARALHSAWRDAQGTPTMDVHGLWPIVIIVGLSYAAGAFSVALLIGLLKAAGRHER